MIKAVIFDMDGLLIDSEPLWQAAEKEAFEEAGIERPREAAGSTTGMREEEVIAHFYHLQPWEGKSQKELLEDVYERLIAKIKAEGKMMPGVTETLELFKNRGLPMALASSSTNEIINTVMDVLDIRHYFDEIYSAEFEAYGKPHPDVFIHTADKLEVKPVECLVFEDAPNGVLAAKAARMKCVAVPDPAHRDHPYVGAADLVIGSLTEFDEKVLAAL